MTTFLSELEQVNAFVSLFQFILTPLLFWHLFRIHLMEKSLLKDLPGVQLMENLTTNHLMLTFFMKHSKMESKILSQSMTPTKKSAND